MRVDEVDGEAAPARASGGPDHAARRRRRRDRRPGPRAGQPRGGHRRHRNVRRGVRLQLARPSAAVLAGALLLAVAGGRAGAAESEATQRLTLFREPSTDNKGVTVLHPQTAVSAALGSAFNINAAYEVDIVSGATPSVFSVDAVSTATK